MSDVSIEISNKLDSLWATEDELNGMTDDQIIELIREDVISFLDGAKWLVVRPRDHSILLEQSTLEESRERDLREFDEWWINEPRAEENMNEQYKLLADCWMAARGHK